MAEIIYDIKTKTLKHFTYRKPLVFIDENGEPQYEYSRNEENHTHIKKVIFLNLVGYEKLKQLDESGKPMKDEYGNLGEVCARIEKHWGTESSFTSNAVGFCITTATRIVSVAFSSCVAGATHSIEIETEEAYRRKGLAEIAAQALLNAHANLGILSHWDCMEQNHASARLAEKLGLVKAYAYDLFWFPIGG